MESERVDCSTNIDDIAKLSVFLFMYCSLITVGRLLSHLMKGMPTAMELRVGFFLQCCALLPWKYRAVKPAVILLVVIFIFNPIAPVRLGNWAAWQTINFVGLACMAYAAFSVQGKRKNIQDESHRLQIEAMRDAQ